MRTRMSKPLRSTAMAIGLSILLGGYWLGLIICGLFVNAAHDLPPLDTFWASNRPVSIEILDRNNRPVLVRGAQDQGQVDFKALPPHVLQAFQSIEDRRFYRHAGIDPVAIARAFYVNVRADRVVQGASTLTQQLAKNVFLTSTKTMHRKLQESLLSLWIERSFTKDEIFSKYLNRIYFGGGTWGLKAASEQYLGKPPQDMTPAEAAMMAGLLKAPSQYNPRANTRAAARRTAVVLGAMNRDGFITDAEHRAALEYPVHIQPSLQRQSSNYFVDWIWRDIEKIMGTPRTDMIIRTTLDVDLQVAAESALLARLDPERGASDGAILALDGQGGVRAMVGGCSYIESEFNRATQAQRQPGSAFKPFVFLTAFNAGLTPWDKRFDGPIMIDDWEPGNFTDTYQGDMTLLDAFIRSVNVIAIKLSEEVGRDSVARTAERFGLGPLKPLRSIALGAQETTLIDLTLGYLPFANWGHTATPYGIISIAPKGGVPVYEHVDKPADKLIDNVRLGYMNYMMIQTVRRGTGRRAHLVGRDVAGKTGTTNDYRDAWFMGYVPDLVMGVWVGADDNTPMQRITGGSIPATIWHDAMEPYLAGRDTARLPITARPVSDKTDNGLETLLKDIETSLP